jgi:hypothetical protein
VAPRASITILLPLAKQVEARTNNVRLATLVCRAL